jgi:SAM-dependent methyltransferase
MFCRTGIVRRIADGSNTHLPGQFDQANLMEQRFTFDQVASVYGKVRPDYPDALVDDVVSYADLKPNDRIFEVGCGTGQATKRAKRDVLLADIAQAINTHGGQFDVDYETHLYIARRIDRD